MLIYMCVCVCARACVCVCVKIWKKYIFKGCIYLYVGDMPTFVFVLFFVLVWFFNIFRAILSDVLSKILI